MLTTTQTATKWARALHRATAHNLIVAQVETITNGHDEYLYFRAKSTSRPESTIHGIRVACTSAGVDVSCSCEGGTKNLACMHAAQTLRAAGLLPDLELVELPDQLPAAA